jgi:hypothetical protein
MFRKIVSNLPFSPSLVGQLGFYAKRLRKEELTRRLSLFFIILTLIVQSLAIFQPPEPANASSASDMVYGGLDNSLDNFLNPYDSNTKNLKDIMNYVGITRNEIAAAKYSSWTSDDKLTWGLTPHFSYAQGERQYSITDSAGRQATTVYSRPETLWYGQGAKIYGWIGNSKKIGWFAIMQKCGNLVTRTTPPPPPPAKCIVNSKLLADDKNCKPCPGNITLWIDNPLCIPNIIKTKTATNISQGFVDASSTTARANDQISYTISVSNTGLNATPIKLEENLKDVLEYSILVDAGGGILNKATGILSWSDITLKPNSKQTRAFVIKLLGTIPSTAQGTSDSTSYDCIMTNTFGNSININIDCPTTKTIEKITTELPKTGATENMIFIGIILSIATYFYFRARQVKKEVRLIRRDANIGTI